ncbi:MAG: MOSC domain-containing protein [Pirellulales bacterium]
MKTIGELKGSIPQIGRLCWIGLAPAGRAEIRSVAEADVRPGTGLEGDHHARSGRSDRQVTLVQHEHLDVVAGILGRADVEPELLRRNLVVSGINLESLKDQQFSIGEVLLKGTGPCAPCSRMEENLGPGGYNAMRGHGGITARVLRGGWIRVGDAVAFEPDAAEVNTPS